MPTKRFETMAPYGILPRPDEWSEPYWQGAKEGKLMIQRCQGCGQYNHPPVFLCRHCKDPKAELAFERVSGRGRIESFYICHDNSVSGWEDRVPYPVISVILDEQSGTSLMGNLLNCEFDEFGKGITIGMPVEAVFDKATNEITVVQWQPARRR